jgi:hypothetical protein
MKNVRKVIETIFVAFDLTPIMDVKGRSPETGYGQENQDNDNAPDGFEQNNQDKEAG